MAYSVPSALEMWGALNQIRDQQHALAAAQKPLPQLPQERLVTPGPDPSIFQPLTEENLRNRRKLLEWPTNDLLATVPSTPDPPALWPIPSWSTPSLTPQTPAAYGGGGLPSPRVRLPHIPGL
jgi:hypothetical protein